MKPRDRGRTAWLSIRISKECEGVYGKIVNRIAIIMLTIILVTVFLASDAVFAASDVDFYNKTVTDESEWLASLQLSNGAIPETSFKGTNGALKETPYFSDFAAMALLESGEKYAANVRKYLEWHFDRLNRAETDICGQEGTIYDYYEYVDQKGNLKEEKVYKVKGKAFYDSTDSYAATFLQLLWKYYRVTGDSTCITAHKADIDRVISAMLCTMNKGLTMARLDYQVKYAMDNAEVYAGARDGARLYSALFAGDENIAVQKSAAAKIRKTMNSKMWNKKGGYYYPALEKNGKPSGKFKWSRFYMDATAQMFPIEYGVISAKSGRAKTLYKSFNKHWSTAKVKNHRWDKMQYPDEYYWGDMPLAAAEMGDKTRVKIYMKTYIKKVKTTGHAYPLTCADCGKVIMAAALARDLH